MSARLFVYGAGHDRCPGHAHIRSRRCGSMRACMRSTQLQAAASASSASRSAARRLQSRLWLGQAASWQSRLQ
jgi:hypothetical protein